VARVRAAPAIDPGLVVNDNSDLNANDGKLNLRKAILVSNQGNGTTDDPSNTSEFSNCRKAS